MGHRLTSVASTIILLLTLTILSLVQRLSADDPTTTKAAEATTTTVAAAQDPTTTKAAEATTTTVAAAQGSKPTTLTYSIDGQQSVLALMEYKGRLYVTRFARDKTKQLAIYPTKSSNPAPTYRTIADSIGPWMNGLAPCPDADNCFYVSSYDANAVFKVDLAKNFKTVKIKVDGGPNGIAVKKNGNILVATYGSKKVLEYTPGGALVREMQDDNNLMGVIALADDRSAVTRNGPQQGVFLLTPELTYVPNGDYGGGMAGARGMAVSGAGYILVADSFNNRILVLDPNLERDAPLPLPTEINKPYAVWLDEKNSRLYVGEGDAPHRVLVFDNVGNFETLFQE